MHMIYIVVYIFLALYTMLYCIFVLEKNIVDSFLIGLIWVLYYIEIIKGWLKKR